MLIWLVASRLSAHSDGTQGPTAKQRKLLYSALLRWLSVPDDQIMSQLLLQLLLLAPCIPPSADIAKGTAEACKFMTDIVMSVNRASQRSPGDLIFAEVQLSFVLTSAPRRSLAHPAAGPCVAASSIPYLSKFCHVCQGYVSTLSWSGAWSWWPCTAVLMLM